MKWVTKKYKYENDPRKDKVWIEKRFAWKPIKVDEDNVVIWLSSYYCLCRLLIGSTYVYASSSSSHKLEEYWKKVQDTANNINSTYSSITGVLYPRNSYSNNAWGNNQIMLDPSLTLIPYDYDFKKDLDNILDS